MAKKYTHMALYNGSTGMVIPIADSKTAEDIFDALDSLCLDINMVLTKSEKEADKYLDKWC